MLKGDKLQPSVSSVFDRFEVFFCGQFGYKKSTILGRPPMAGWLEHFKDGPQIYGPKANTQICMTVLH